MVVEQPKTASSKAIHSTEQVLMEPQKELLLYIADTFVVALWVSVREPHTSAFNFEFCLYGTYVMAGVIGTAGHSYCLLLLPPCEPIVLLHS